MPKVHVSITAELLREADRAARRLKVSRSKLVRDAVRAHLKRIEEERDRRGYERYPESLDQFPGV